MTAQVVCRCAGFGQVTWKSGALLPHGQITKASNLQLAIGNVQPASLCMHIDSAILKKWCFASSREHVISITTESVH